MKIIDEPRGRWGRARDKVLAANPELQPSLVIVVFGNALHLLHRWQGPLGPEDRLAALARAADRNEVDLASIIGDRPRSLTSHFALTVDGLAVVVEAQVCDCHDGPNVVDALAPHGAADFEQVVATAAGAALRSMAPPEMHASIAEAEVILDVERALAAAERG